MVCKYRSECKLHRSDNLPESNISTGYRHNVCDYPSAEEHQHNLDDYYDLSKRGMGGGIGCVNRTSMINPPEAFNPQLGEKNCQLYQAWEENAKLRKQGEDLVKIVRDFIPSPKKLYTD